MWICARLKITHLWGCWGPASLGRHLNQNWSAQPDICSSTLEKKETEVAAYVTVKEKWRKNGLKPRLHLWPFTRGTNAGDVNYRAEMKHKKMRIRSVPVGLLKTISTEPWRPKMYNTNHGWHPLTAQVIAANNLHREHWHHKQPVKASSPSLSGPLQHAATQTLSEPSQVSPAVDWPSRTDLMVGFYAESSKGRTLGRFFELKAKIGELLKTTSAITLNGGVFVHPQLCLSWKSHTCGIVAVTLS